VCQIGCVYSKAEDLATCADPLLGVDERERASPHRQVEQQMHLRLLAGSADLLRHHVLLPDVVVDQ